MSGDEDRLQVLGGEDPQVIARLLPAGSNNRGIYIY